MSRVSTERLRLLYQQARASGRPMRVTFREEAARDAVLLMNSSGHVLARPQDRLAILSVAASGAWDAQYGRTLDLLFTKPCDEERFIERLAQALESAQVLA